MVKKICVDDLQGCVLAYDTIQNTDAHTHLWKIWGKCVPDSKVWSLDLHFVELHFIFYVTKGKKDRKTAR